MSPGTQIAATKKRADLLRPLSEDRYELRFTVRAETREKLAQATDLLRHVVPDGSVAEVIDRALTVLLRDLGRRKFAATCRADDGATAERRRTEESRRPVPSGQGGGAGEARKEEDPTQGTTGQAQGNASQTRHIPARVRRAVWLRDDGQCAFVGKAAGRCGERGFLEFHHVHPYGAGGEATIENIALRCRAHNGHEAEVFYGRRFGRELQPELQLEGQQEVQANSFRNELQDL